MLHRAAPLLLLLAVTAACQPAPVVLTDSARARSQILVALDRYLAAARVVDPAGMSAAFTTDGVLFEPGIHPVESRDSIRAFLGSFPGATVESVTAVPDTIEVHGRTAYLWGSYFERLTFPGQPRSEQHGRFVIEWLQQPDSGWQIRRYFRVPVPSPAP